MVALGLHGAGVLHLRRLAVLEYPAHLLVLVKTIIVVVLRCYILATNLIARLPIFSLRSSFLVSLLHPGVRRLLHPRRQLRRHLQLIRR